MIDVEARMRELCRPIEQQILMCDNKEDILMMACAMLQHVKTPCTVLALKWIHDLGVISYQHQQEGNVRGNGSWRW